MVHIPDGTTKRLPKDTYIQCFNEALRLDVAELRAGFDKGHVHWTCNLKDFLAKIRDVVEMSDVLSRQDIEDILRII